MIAQQLGYASMDSSAAHLHSGLGLALESCRELQTAEPSFQFWDGLGYYMMLEAKTTQWQQPHAPGGSCVRLDNTSCKTCKLSLDGHRTRRIPVLPKNNITRITAFISEI